MIDLHTHSYMSDGDISPANLILKAKKIGLKAIALTDHDTTNGLNEAIIQSKESAVELIPGTEISCYNTKKGFFDIHIVGLFIDKDNENLNKTLNKLKESRIRQKKEIISRLNKLGYDISFSEVRKKIKGEMGRPHLAKTLKEKYPSEFSSISDVFNKLIGKDKPAYVEHKYKLSLKDCIKALKEAGGITILAHPGHYSKDVFDSLIKYLIDVGIDGIDTYFPYHKNYKNISFQESEKINRYFTVVAEKFDLIKSGGSDYHGSIKPVKLGEAKVPYWILIKMKRYLNKTR